MSNFLHLKNAQVVAVCDVKQDQLRAAQKAVNDHYKNSDCAAFADFRQVLERKDIDACLIATPDHWHVPLALQAVRSGKDIYLEKPMGLTMEENWALRKECVKRNAIFQFGTQQRSTRIFRLACELVRNGYIGSLKHINVWAPGSAPGGSNKVVPPPAGLDYDRWLGPAPSKPHTENLCSDDSGAKTWWFKSEYALGFIAGWGIHPIDIAAWGAGDLFRGPIGIEGRGTFYGEGACDTATVWNIDFTFGSGVSMKFVGVPNGGNQGLGTCDKWLQEEEWKSRYRRITSHGTAFEGTGGWVHVDRDGINLQPENLIDQDPAKFSVKLASSSNHAGNFVDSVLSRKPTVCPIEESVFSDSLCHLSELAIRLNTKLTWDPDKEKFVDSQQANLRLRARKPRAPWTL
jgi:predicted dehydrogenase